ncbi:AroB-related putative sugar phosphate phospholyase (cyclizing) [Parafilimonas sp.]|uniref:AroB-related putative sugar phosphate phospholyase (cyclizing) n=1 Tax=Parafilimonas sp. TaxID=1969739 RepID=UPI0039E584E0
MYNFTVKSSIHDYEVLFIDGTKKTLQEVLKKGDVIIIDRKVQDLYKTDLEETLNNYYHISIDANEKQKSYQGAMPVIQELIDNGFRKNHRLIAIGGGITQDLTAFMASILYRGVDWYFFPTSLLAQGDSCIGSKTSINFNQYKNQVGGFYPPNKIFINTAFLNTLSLPELKSGLGEMLHYFIVSGEEDFRRFKNDYPFALKDKEVLKGIIARSLAIKKSYIEIDEFDKKERQVFNYGHTFGHAIESLTNYRIPHGIAVSYGMDMANFISVKKGYIPETVRDDVRELVQQIWEGAHITDISLDTYITALSKDKKNVDTRLGLILSKGLGKIFKDLTPPDDTFKSWLKEYFDTQLN